MFTGIVAEVGRVLSLESGVLTVSAGGTLKGIELGASVAVNGACLTVTRFGPDSFSVDLSPETLGRTNLGSLTSGQPVNLERALALGGELGGHLVQGHVDGTGVLVSITSLGSSHIVRSQAPPEIMRYLVEKGFVAVDGISLTITAVGTGYFEVSVVDYTLRHTNLKGRRPGDRVNLEVDIMAKYVERFLRVQRPGINEGFLQEHGFK